jgi:DNA invertase Pin-like site-specific DNA recombinase
VKLATSSPERQRESVLTAAASVGAHIIGWADDWEVSGATDPVTRPKLGPWLRDERGPYDGLVAAAVDRLGRNVVDCLNTGYKMRDEKKMLVTYGHDGAWNLDDPADESRFTMEAWGAQMELRAIQRRSRDATVKTRAAGRPKGKPSYGFQYVRKVMGGKIDHVELHPHASEVIREVARRILAAPHTTFLGDILSCPRCGTTMTGSGGDRGRMYRCRARALYGRDTYPGVVVRAEHIDAAVEAMWLSQVTALDHSDPGLDAIVRRWSVLHNPERDDQRKELMAGLDAARTRRDLLETDYYIASKVTAERFVELSAAQTALIESLEKEAARLSQEADLSVFFSDGDALAEVWEQSSMQDRRMPLRCVLKSLTITVPKYPGDKTPIMERLVPEWVG